MNEIETHLSKLFADVPESGRKNEIVQEITQNLNEKLSDLMQTGLSREQAVFKTIEDFGDIDDLKEELESSAKILQSKRSGLSLAFSIWGSVLILGLVLFINLYYTPRVIWFVYPAFAVVWWPMSLFFHWLRLRNGMRIGFPFSLCGFILILGLMLFINFTYTPRIIWFVYPAFGAIWWPLALLFHAMRQNARKGEDADG